MRDFVPYILPTIAALGALVSAFLSYRVNKRVRDIESSLQTKDGAVKRLTNEEDVKEEKKGNSGGPNDE